MTGKPLRALQGQDHPSRGLAFSADGKLVVSGGSDGTVRLWGAAGGKEVRRFSTGNEAGSGPQVVTFRLSGDGRRLAALSDDPGTGLSDARVSVWETATGKLLARRPSRGNFASRFTPDAEALTVGSPGGLAIEEAATGRTLVTVPAKPGAPGTFSPDGRLLAVAMDREQPARLPPGAGLPAGGDPTDTEAISLIEAVTGHEIVRIKTGPVDPFVFAFSADGGMLAAADPDGVRVWEAATGRELHRRPLPERPAGGFSFVTSIAFGPGRNTLATGLADGTVLVWDVRPVRRGADAARRDLSRDEAERL